MSNMVVRTNVFALNAHRNMKNVGLEQGRASNRLSSGFRINSAADDAAGLAISETMRAQIRGLDQASRNAQDGQAMLLTTEGGLEEIGNMLQRVRELLNQASNDTNTQLQRDMIRQEIEQLGQEIQGMQERVEFNTNQVLNIGNHGEIRVTIAEAQVNFAEASGEMAEASADRAEAVITARVVRDFAIQEARDELRTEMLAASQEFNIAIRTSGTSEAAYIERGTALAIRDRDFAEANTTFRIAYAEARLDYAEAVSEANDDFAEAMTAFQVERNAFVNIIAGQLDVFSTTQRDGVAWFQVGANSNQGIEFDFELVSQAVLVSGSLVRGIAEALVVPGTTPDTGVGFGANISPMIDNIDQALDSINNVRANLGAVQNRMDYTMRSLDISSENLQDSESRVRNADIAREMMRFTMSNVLQQAAISMLAQANQMPQNLLQILR